MQLGGPSSSTIFSRFSLFGLLFRNLKTNLHGRNFGSNEGVTDIVDEYLEDKASILKVNSVEECIEAKGNYIEK